MQCSTVFKVGDGFQLFSPQPFSEQIAEVAGLLAHLNIPVVTQRSIMMASTLCLGAAF